MGTLDGRTNATKPSTILASTPFCCLDIYSSLYFFIYLCEYYSWLKKLHLKSLILLSLAFSLSRLNCHLLSRSKLSLEWEKDAGGERKREGENRRNEYRDRYSEPNHRKKPWNRNKNCSRGLTLIEFLLRRIQWSKTELKYFIVLKQNSCHRLILRISLYF